MHLALQLLGPFQATIDGEIALETRAKKLEALLAYLALESETPHRRESLVGLLFPEMPEEQARSNLRQTLTRLRRAIHDAEAEPPFLLTTREATQFNSDSDHSLDVRAFRSLLTGCPDHGPTADAACAACMQQAAAAVALYHGPFLEGFFIDDSPAFEEWLHAVRQSLEEEALDALQRLATFHEQRGEYPQATRYARRLIELAPWGEEAHQQLMRLLAYQGRRESALKQYLVLEAILAADLGIEPLPETRRWRDRIMETTAVRPYQLPPRNPLFVGRSEESSQLQALINHPQRRLVSLVGPGGSGKTALALETSWQVATRFLGPFIDGVFFVSLSSVTTPAEPQDKHSGFDPLATAVAETLGFAFSGPKSPQQQLLRYLHDKSLLLILDNMEHLLPVALPFLEVLLAETTDLQLMVTTRERLGLAQEWVVDISGLPYPPASGTPDAAAGTAEQYPALDLFVRQSRRLQPDFDLVQDSAGYSGGCTLPAAMRITRLVQGLPLGIELAASWTRVLDCDEIAAQLEENLDFLQSTQADQPARHQSLRAVFDYSWQMLDEREKDILRRLSVFRDRFDLNAATAVSGASLVTLSNLIDRSWLRRHSASEAGSVAAPFEFLEVLRQFAAEKLAAEPQTATETEERYARHYLNMLALQHHALQGGDQLRALEIISTNMAHLRTSWRWAARNRADDFLRQALAPLGLFYYMRSWFNEGAELFGFAATAIAAVEEIGTRAALRAELIARQGWFIFLLGEQQAGSDLLAESVAILRRDGQPEALAYALNFRAATLSLLGNYAAAAERAQEALRLSTAHDDSYGQIIAQNILSQIAFQDGDYPAAKLHCSRSLALERASENYWSIGFSLTNLGRVAFAQGDYAAARQHFQESLTIRRKMEDARGQALSLRYLGNTAAMLNDFEQARQDYEESLALFRRIGSQDDTAATLNSMGWLATYQQDATAAHSAFLAALRIAHEATAVPRMLEALAGLATVEAAANPALAQHLAQIVAAHPASGYDNHVRANELLAALAAPSSPDSSPRQTNEDLTAVVDALIWQDRIS